MTIKKRLAVSNVLMLLVPVITTVLIALGCLALIWLVIAHGVGIGFEDSEDFYRASAGISELAAEGLRADEKAERLEALKTLSSFLDRGAMSLVVTADGEEFYRYGEAGASLDDMRLAQAAQALGNEGTLSSGTRNMHVRSLSSDGTHYVIRLYNTQRQLSYTSLKAAMLAAGGVLGLAILLSVFFTDRFLTRFVWRRIEEPLELLAGGVRQISGGNLDYRLEYSGRDEFMPVCRDFNDMAARLKDSVERSRREEESRKELMAGISHDLRTPLTSILAYVEGLLDGVAKTPEAQRRYLVTIRARAEELESMVSRILSYSRAELGNAARSVAALRLDRYLEAETAAMSADYAGRGLDISCALCPYTVNADENELRQLITNIADNSLKYKLKERASLRVTLEDQGENCLLTFADDGPGVAEEALGKLFDVFYRADPSRSDRGKGSGLGLAIVEKTVRRMGGTVKAENCPRCGLAIIIKLPRGGES